MSFTSTMFRRSMSTVARAVKCVKPGHLELQQATVPSAESGQVVVKMLAASVNEFDAALVSGRAGACSGIVGSEGVGVVTGVGNNVNGINIDDWVVPAAPQVGTLTEYVVADAASLQVVPNDISVADAALLGGTSCTALRLLSDFGADGVVVQNAANSAVGQALIQIAKARGIKTINIIPDGGDADAAVQHLKDLGGDIVVTETYANSRNFKNLVADLPAPTLGVNGAGGSAATAVARTVGEGATLVTYGGSGAVTVPTSVLVGKSVTLNGFSLARWNAGASAAERGAMIDEVAALVQDGALRSNVAETSFSDFISSLDSFAGQQGQSVSAQLVTM